MNPDIRGYIRVRSLHGGNLCVSVCGLGIFKITIHNKAMQQRKPEGNGTKNNYKRENSRQSAVCLIVIKTRINGFSTDIYVD